MKNEKLSKVGIWIFLGLMILFIVFSGYVFFNNSSNLEINIRSNNEQMKRDEVVNEALTRILVDKNDSISTLGITINKLELAHESDSVAITRKDSLLKKVTHERDSLANLLRTYKWSDIEPVTAKPTN